MRKKISPEVERANRQKIFPSCATLRQNRERVSLTQSGLCSIIYESSGIWLEPSQISKIETGYSKAYPKYREAIANVFRDILGESMMTVESLFPEYHGDDIENTLIHESDEPAVPSTEKEKKVS